MRYAPSPAKYCRETAEPCTVAIIGGGPGGLFSARHLTDKLGDACRIKIFEASERLGGKIVTGEFAGVGPYEAGVAEIYDYSSLGPDPLRHLIETELGLEIRHIAGGSCILDGQIIHDVEHLGAVFGSEARDQVVRFKQKCAELLSVDDFYASTRNVDNHHSWARKSGEETLYNEITNDAARRYVRIMAHSDVAAPPHLTNGLTFLKNVLMDVPGYMDVFSVVGGNEQIVDGLCELIDAEVHLGATVKSVKPLFDGRFQLDICTHGAIEHEVVDYVVVCLPLTALSIIDWRSPHLKAAMDQHINYFDRPGHYLRATLLFERPFWREHISGAWWMLDAFDGCCAYDEGARTPIGPWGALGFLIAGNAALGLANMSDEDIERLCLDALPPAFGDARRLLVDRRIHRWMASVNAIPGGYPVRSAYVNHRPAAKQYPGLLVVGDYMFDATLNGVLDSADAASDIIVSEVMARRRAQFAPPAPRRDRPAEVAESARSDASRNGALNGSYLAEIMEAAWGVQPGARILHFGSGSGKLLSDLRALGFDAIGVEPCRAAWEGTPHRLRGHNLRICPQRLPFPDGSFDVVIETGLCRLERDQLTEVITEIRRVASRGFILGSVTSDLPIEVIERHELLTGIKTLTSRWGWSDLLLSLGFRFAFADPAKLDSAWRLSVGAGVAPSEWFEDAECLRYCTYDARQETASRDIATAAEVARIIAEHLYDDDRVPVRPMAARAALMP
ncbi:FAD-dependent oxidoreductase [Xanthobacter sp. V7C-4]|uniref:FAD-dependent oxidoreductase n=1 Tax=Xanthobacter autotrophicus (strain ATCC BAA-1158 / Py2) TaxID=78245 RepID=UPI003729EB32